jgi:bifunctional UDP-N-acetylglucosamine pyrophosphorylase/glucosamine-1-phosphate N-acetyltransferase
VESNISVIILAAGKGTRMKSDVPKVLHKISGKQMLYYSIKEAKKISDDITVVLYHQAELVQKEMEIYFDDINYKIQDHENYPGTGGAIKNIDVKYDKVLVLNGDMPLVKSSELEKFAKIDADIVLSVFDLSNPNGYGRVVIENENIQKIVEQKDANQEQLKINTVNAGVYMFTKEILNDYVNKIDNNNAQEEYYITDFIELGVNDNKSIKPLFVNGENFKGVNSKYDLANAEIIMQNSIKRTLMESGVQMRLPDTIYIEDGVIIKPGSVIENGVSIIGETTIENSIIKTNSVIENSFIKNSDVGPMARIRPHSNIIDSHIGNFVEAKKADLNGVKAGHLSYLGDCEINSGTNIGAGVITCNYDGKNKHKTIIGKDVFVGSDSQFIAPVVVEDEVIIGSGTTVTKNIPKGSLAISRTNIKFIRDFFYKFFNKQS